MSAKLTETDVIQWKRWLKASADWREPYEDTWQRTVDYLQGKFLDEIPEEDTITVNLVHPMVRVIIPAIYSKNPDILVVPRRKDFELQAKAMQDYLRYLVKEVNLKAEVKLCILDALLMSHSWMKTGWQTNFVAAAEDSVMGKKASSLVKRVARRMGIIKPSDSDVIKENEKMFSMQPNELISSESPWACRVSPWDIFVPAFSRNPNELPWIAQRYVRTLRDVRDNPEFNNTAEVKGSTDVRSLLKSKSGESRGPDIDDDMEYVILYEITDCRAGRIYTICDTTDKPLDDKANQYGFLKARHNYVRLCFNEVPDQFYGMNDVEAWESQLEELNKIRSQMTNHRKRFNRRYIYTEDAFTEEGLEQLKSGVDGTLVPTDKELDKCLKAVEDAQLPPDVYAVESRIKDDITNISGITDYQKGSLAQGAKTATEASIVEAQSRYRADERLDVVGEFAVRVIQNLAAISQEFMSPNQVFPIIGDDAVFWLNIKDKRMIRGDFLFEIVFGSSVPKNPDVERQQIIQSYPLLANDPLFDPLKPRMEFLRKVMGVKDPESWIAKNLLPLVSQLRQVEIMKAIAANRAVEGQEGEETEAGVDDTEVTESVPNPASLLDAASPIQPGGPGGGSRGPLI